MTRESQILDHLNQVKLIAHSIYRRLPANSVSLDDLISTGTLGLIAAVDRYDPVRGHKLKTYAEYKIRGAITDSLRSLDAPTRTARKFIKRSEAAGEQLEQTLERPPSEAELAAALGVTLERYHRLRREAAVSLIPIEHRNAEGKSFQEALQSPIADPLRATEAREVAERIHSLLRRLPRDQRQVVELSFWEGLTLRSIGERMGLHESRISQLRSAALANLRRRCAPAERLAA